MIWKIIIGAIVVIALGYYILFNYNYVKPGKLDFTLGDIDNLAGSDDKLPVKVEIISVGRADVPGPFVASSPRKKTYEFSFTTFKISYADSSYVIVDPSHNEESHYKFPYSVSYNKDNYKLIQDDLKNAKGIYFTHMHWDHVEGFSKSSYAAALKESAHFTPEQSDSKFIKESQQDVVKGSNVLEYEKHTKIAPGIVAIKTPGHTDCSQSFFVKTTSGSYFIYGDTVYIQENIDDLKGRALMVSIMSGETSQSRSDTSDAIGFIYGLQKKGVVAISSHDIETQKTQIEGSYPDVGWVKLN